jgi:ABC-type branched-subunit amino acid transport system ATPase component
MLIEPKLELVMELSDRVAVMDEAEGSAMGRRPACVATQP